MAPLWSLFDRGDELKTLDTAADQTLSFPNVTVTSMESPWMKESSQQF